MNAYRVFVKAWRKNSEINGIDFFENLNFLPISSFPEFKFLAKMHADFTNTLYYKFEQFLFYPKKYKILGTLKDYILVTCPSFTLASGPLSPYREHVRRREEKRGPNCIL